MSHTGHTELFQVPRNMRSSSKLSTDDPTLQKYWSLYLLFMFAIEKTLSFYILSDVSHDKISRNYCPINQFVLLIPILYII